MRHVLKKLLKNERGIAMLEFIIVFPFLFLLLFGGLEIARYIVIIQKVENAAYVITDAVGQLNAPQSPSVSGEANVAAIQNAMELYDTMMWPYNNPSRESVVISSVKNEGGMRYLRWQRSLVGSGSVTSVTGVGPTNSVRTMSGPCSAAPFTSEYSALLTGMLPNENMIVGEVFYDYVPLWQSMLGGVTAATPEATGGGGFSIGPRTISRRIFLHPRNGDLVDLPNPPAQPLIEENSPCVGGPIS